MSTLKQARDSGKLDQFAKKHEDDAPGDEEAFNRAVNHGIEEYAIYDYRALDRAFQVTPERDVLGVSPQNVVTGCYEVLMDLNSDYCQAIRRNTLTGSLSGDIAFGVQQLTFNTAVLKTRGFDFGLDYRRKIGTFEIAFDFEGNYIKSYNKQGVTFIPGTECAGKFGFACNIVPMPKWKHAAMLTVGVDGINLATRWRYIGAVEQDEGTDILAARIPAFSYIDTTLNFDVADRFTFRIGVQNLFDKDPPLVGASAGATDVNAANTFPTVYDSLGRTFFAGVTAKF